MITRSLFAILHLAWSPDGRHIAVCGGGSAKTIRILSAETLATERVYRGHALHVRGLAWSLTASVCSRLTSSLRIYGTRAPAEWFQPTLEMISVSSPLDGHTMGDMSRQLHGVRGLMSGGHPADVKHAPIWEISARSRGHPQGTELPWQDGAKLRFGRPSRIVQSSRCHVRIPAAYSHLAGRRMAHVSHPAEVVTARLRSGMRCPARSSIFSNCLRVIVSILKY